MFNALMIINYNNKKPNLMIVISYFKNMIFFFNRIRVTYIQCKSYWI